MLRRRSKERPNSNRFSGSSFRNSGFGTSELSIMRLCREYIKRNGEGLQTETPKSRTSADEIIECASAIKESIQCLLNAFHSKNETIPLDDSSSVRNASLSLALCIELLCTVIKVLRYDSESSFVGDIINSLGKEVEILSQNCANFLTGLEKKLGPIVEEHFHAISDNIIGLSRAAGELAIATHKGEDFDVDDDVDAIEMEEEELALQGFASRMIQLDESMTSDGPVQGIDKNILEAFQRGTQMHVEKSMEILSQDMDSAAVSCYSNLKYFIYN